MEKRKGYYKFGKHEMQLCFNKNVPI